MSVCLFTIGIFLTANHRVSNFTYFAYSIGVAEILRFSYYVEFLKELV